MMSDEVTEELKNQIVEFFKQKGKMMTHRDVANGLGLDQKLVKKALTELVNAGTLEFTSFGGATFIKLPEA
ncbi:MAG: dissimilatory sulfite reductase D family protein [Chloroflexota bacterium]|jgi:predicted ArsR family transcriptional regulator